MKMTNRRSHSDIVNARESWVLVSGVGDLEDTRCKNDDIALVVVRKSKFSQRCGGEVLHEYYSQFKNLQAKTRHIAREHR